MESDQDTFQEHSESPYHWGLPLDHDRYMTFSKRNPTCGDEITWYLRILNNQIHSAYFQAKGCLLCRTAASVLCQNIEGQSVASVQQLDSQAALKGIGINVTPGRIQCVLISLTAVHGCLSSIESSQHDT